MINGYEYSFEDISILFAKRLTIGFTDVKYGSQKEHTNIYGRGGDPVAMGRGKKTYTGSIKLNQSELEAIQAQLPKGKDLCDMAPFTIIVSYAPEAGVITTDELLYCRVTQYEKGMAQGAMNMEIDLPLIIGKINYNV